MIKLFADILIATMLVSNVPAKGEAETYAETTVTNESAQVSQKYLPKAQNDFQVAVIDDSSETGISLSDEEYWNKTEDFSNLPNTGAGDSEPSETETAETGEEPGIVEPVLEEKLPEPEKEVEIKPEIIVEEKEEKEPEIKVEEKKEENFDYDIASYITKYSESASNNSRNYNMLLASDSIDGVILRPGESFSYNDVILKNRTKERDYKNAPVIVNGKLEDGIGGGICQISSTLYNAALYSKMTIENRRNHSMKVGYMPAGRDATVSWGSIDLVFKNNLNVPVKIESKMGGGTLKIRFLSTENPQVGDIKINVFKDKNGGYYLERLVNGVKDYSAYSKYKN